MSEYALCGLCTRWVSRYGLEKCGYGRGWRSSRLGRHAAAMFQTLRDTHQPPEEASAAKKRLDRTLDALWYFNLRTARDESGHRASTRDSHRFKHRNSRSTPWVDWIPKGATAGAAQPNCNDVRRERPKYHFQTTRPPPLDVKIAFTNCGDSSFDHIFTK